MFELPPLSLYVHVPWCVRKCPYCDFNSHALMRALPEERYIRQLEIDLFSELPKIQGRQFESIFIGGGTPSLISPKMYGKLLSDVGRVVPFNQDIEVTLEVNPGSCEYGNVFLYQEIGINRFSVGVQSFQDDKLKALGRIHSAKEAIKILHLLRKVEDYNFNIDLMYGLPGQTLEDVEFDLKCAISMEPSHISWYQLTIERNTEFYSKPPKLPIDDNIYLMQKKGRRILEDAGYIQYEISAYALPGKYSRHNLNYWEFGDYIGIGAGAHGKWSDRVSGQILRNRKTRMPNTYLNKKKQFEVEQRILTADDIPIEFLMNALRLIDGVEECHYTNRTGMDISILKKRRDEVVIKGLLEPGERLQATRKGLLFLNDLLECFVVAV